MRNGNERFGVGMSSMFWAWMGIITIGLTVMIVIPLAGR